MTVAIWKGNSAVKKRALQPSTASYILFRPNLSFRQLHYNEIKMKPITAVFLFLLGIHFSTTTLAEDDKSDYSGCGSTAQEARKELSKSLHTRSASSFSSEVSETKNNFFNHFTSKATSKSSESSKMTLCNVSVKKTGDQYCATVSHSALSKCAANKLDAQMNYLSKNLPTVNSARLAKAKEWLDDIVYSDQLYTALGRNNFDKDQLNQLVPIENNLLKILDNQFVRFNIKGASATITIGDNQKVPANQDIAMKVGNYRYAITSSGYCPIEGNVQLSSKGRSVVTYDLEKYRFPEITFSSNITNAALSVGGKPLRVGTTKTFQRCSGTLAYSFSHNGVTKEGNATLSPGLRTTIRKTLPSAGSLAKVKAYKSGKLWQVQLQNMLLNHETQGVSSLSGFSVGRVFLKESFRWGYQASFATDSEEAYSYQIVSLLGLQMLDYNDGKEVLILGPLVFMPILGLEIGLAYHDINGVSTFEEEGADDWTNFYQSYVILRPKIGFDLAVNKDISIAVNYSRSIYVNKSDILSIGAGFRF